MSSGFNSSWKIQKPKKSLVFSTTTGWLDGKAGKMERLLTSRNVDLGTRIRLLKCYVWSTLLYGCETWTVSKTMEARLEAAEMWFYRRMLKVSWVEKVSNTEVLRRAGVQQDLVLKIIHRQISFIGHVLRKGQLEEAALTGRIQGKRARGRQRGTLLG